MKALFIIMNEDRPHSWTQHEDVAHAIVDEFNNKSQSHTWWMKKIEKVPDWREDNGKNREMV